MLQEVSSSELLKKIKILATQERSLTAQVIEHLEEIDRRRLHLEMGYPSLYEFAMQELGYCKTSAHHRISAMRLTRDVPEVRAGIEDGRLSLTNLSQAQAFLKHEKKEGHAYSVESKRELLEKLEGKSTRDCIKLLAGLAPGYIPKEKVRVVSDTETEIKFVADAELMADLERIRLLISHQYPHPTYAELFKKLAKTTLEKLTPQTSAVPAQELGMGRSIPVKTRRFVSTRDGGRCTYVDEKSGRRCGSSFQLETDHILPFAKGGTHRAENLRLLCRAHNSLHAIHSYGIEKMAAFIKKR